MNRVASTVLVMSSAALLATRVIAPASSAPVEPALSSNALAPDQVSEAVVEVNTQVDRLRERLMAPVAYPAPSRDPFSFGIPPERRGGVERAPVLAPAPVAAPVQPVLPRLVAIISGSADESPWRAAFAQGDGIELVVPGEAVGRFLVSVVSGDGVTLVDPQSGASFIVSLQ